MDRSFGFRYTSTEDNNLFKLVSIGHEITHDENYQWDGMKREGAGFIFQYTLKGAGMLRIGEEQMEVGRHQALWVQIPSDHAYWFNPAAAEQWEFIWIRFEGIKGENLRQEVMGLDSSILAIHPEAAPITLLWQLYEDVNRKQIGDRFDLSLRIYEWLLSLQRFLHSREAVAFQDIPAAYRTVAGHIDHHYGSDLSLDQLAEVAGLNKYYLCKMFPLYYHVSTMDYLRNRRIEKAAELLQKPHLTIKEIAFRCGFHDAGYFGKVFHKMMGMSPGTYRETASKHEDYIRLLE
ncbi:AraC family transcriptional regulator [Bacillus sp. 3255]|uniref:AraC family transcriptional regulator n=1 Tax=Bacillus sp. 3255 TaxID=2817904 RepID=UPI00286425FC|nr:AraC family transcriptional regulator [Bacillus sp. 3255]MDR6880901.1 AraC-like DNA-binding protein [Bacillus sp. 3255]